MKLAEVATGGPQQWTFENLPEEPSTPCDEEIVSTLATANQSGTASTAAEDTENCKNGDYNNENGENVEPLENSPASASAASVADIENAPIEDMHCNGHEEPGNAASATAFKNGSSDNQEMASPASASNAAGQRPPALSSTVTENKPDPVTEIAPDLQVKIADLGNACWVVSHQDFWIFQSP